MREPTIAEIKGFDVGTLVSVANTLGISRARWNEPKELRALMIERRAEQVAERESDGPCPECGAEWKPTSPGASSREIWHAETCEYILFFEDESEAAGDN